MSAEVAIGGMDAPASALPPGRSIFRAHLEADAIVGAELVGRPVLAFAGIARPEKFYATLEGLGAQIAARRQFADHHSYDPKEIDEIVAIARRRGLTAVTTEKDYVRLTAAQRLMVRALPVTLRFEAPERVASALSAALQARRLDGRAQR